MQAEHRSGGGSSCLIRRNGRLRGGRLFDALIDCGIISLIVLHALNESLELIRIRIGLGGKCSSRETRGDKAGDQNAGGDRLGKV